MSHVFLIVAMIVVVTVAVIMVVIVGIHLYFREEIWGKERGLCPPFGWCRITQGVRASFRLEPKNQGVVDSF